jgi:hypothetical protein
LPQPGRTVSEVPSYGSLGKPTKVGTMAGSLLCALPVTLCVETVFKRWLSDAVFRTTFGDAA